MHVEADAGWLPYWLQRMEQHCEFSGNAEHPDLKLRPTEYFKRNVFVACRGDEMTLPSVVELVGDDNLVFNTDYPHPDGTWPWGMERLARAADPRGEQAQDPLGQRGARVSAAGLQLDDSHRPEAGHLASRVRRSGGASPGSERLPLEFDGRA